MSFRIAIESLEEKTITVQKVSASFCIVGRGDQTDVQVTDLRCSRAHLAIRRTEERCFEIEVIGSAAPMELGDLVVRKANVRPGESIKVGHTVLRLLPEPPAKEEMQVVNAWPHLFECLPEAVKGRFTNFTRK